MSSIKKILFSLFVLSVLCNLSFAQDIEIDPLFMESNLVGKFGYGFYGSVPTIKYHFSSDISGQVGISISKVYTSGASDNTFSMLVQADNTFIRFSEIDLKYGGFASLSKNNSNSSFVLAGTIGVERKLAQNLVVGFKIIPASVTFSSSSTILGILSGSFVSAHFYF